VLFLVAVRGGTVSGKDQIRAQIEQMALPAEDLRHKPAPIPVQAICPSGIVFAYIEVAYACAVNHMCGIEALPDLHQRIAVRYAKGLHIFAHGNEHLGRAHHI